MLVIFINIYIYININYINRKRQIWGITAGILQNCLLSITNEKIFNPPCPVFSIHRK